MFNNDKIIKSIRRNEVKIYCKNIKILQKKDNGLLLKGHGSISQNKQGNLFVEFVCISSDWELSKSGKQSFYTQFPSDPLVEAERLFGEFETLDGDILSSEGFKVDVNMFDRTNCSVHRIFLHKLEIVQPRESKDLTKSFLYFETLENVRIHPNKLNKTTSTTGYENSAWDETIIEFDNVKVSIRKEEHHTIVKATGLFETVKLYESLRLYFGLMSGVLSQSYYQSTGYENEEIHKIHSVRNGFINIKIPVIIPEFITTGRKTDGEHSYNLLKKIYLLSTNFPLYFNCICSHWERVWHGFKSVNEITELTLSTAVEGILNDIYIPYFKANRKDVDLENDIGEIKELLSKLDFPSHYKDKINNSLNHWGEFTASKAFDELVIEGVLLSSDKKNWNKIRNSSAHPKTVILDGAKEQKKRDEVIACINIFYKLILNVLSYEGPVSYLQYESKFESEELTYINVLG